MARTLLNQSLAVTELLADLPITKEATTSRVVVNNPLLRVVLFAMDAGQQLTEHSSPRAVVVQLLSGKMTFTVAGEANVLSPGDVIYLAPDERHAVVADEPCHMALVMVDCDHDHE
ncbi:cupin domain-containing protein [Corynebacterium spheniscorum]|uniref:Cupin domain protein n=1 Tax=Corynebacterium spheniscorum TaxID=185761 RepID=A0A1I2RZ62_9CORY|nr:cupin domain-containing protein [Corynebacterium spheniscorum]KAA8721002.1 cupin domain-containing protein [Corynebacterium spheniscorum]SFG44829.1 Cupin domain protein [Corynebacterium spheniscorum]